MQARSEKRRPRISVSLDPEDYDWIESMTAPSESLSYRLSRIVRAARLAGVSLEDAKAGGVLEAFSGFLAKKKKNKHAAELHQLLSEFLDKQ